jgi:hypothetical protein
VAGVEANVCQAVSLNIYGVDVLAKAILLYKHILRSLSSKGIDLSVVLGLGRIPLREKFINKGAW